MCSDTRLDPLASKYSFRVNFFLPFELSNAIVKLLNDTELREKLGLSGYNFVNEECNCVSMAKNSLKLYEDILEEMQNDLNNG